jgi:predicted metal-binding membrane protein
MALLFVAGVMNILWIAALTLLVCLEKMLPPRARINVASGLLLAGWGVFVLAQRLTLGMS